MKENNNGITLIVLVITIIVLLILAGVSIAMLTGDNGILTQAQNAKIETDKAKIIEDLKLKILEKQMDGELIYKEDIETILNDSGYFTDVPEDITLDTELTTTKENGNYTIKVSEIYEGDLKEEPITASNFPASNYGAIVTNYTCPNVAGVNAWKIFYADGTNIYLIADDYIHKDYCPGSANNAISGNEYKLSMDNVIKDYQGSTSITDEKIQELNSDYFNKGYSSTENNMKAVAYMLDTNVWSVFAGDKAEYAIGGPTIEMLIKSYSEKYEVVAYKAEASNTTGYKISNDSGASWKNYISNMLSKQDSLYTINSTSKASSMWIASPSAYETNDVQLVAYNGYVGYDDYNNTHTGFRPLVFLRSDVQLEKNDNGSYTIK